MVQRKRSEAISNKWKFAQDSFLSKQIRNYMFFKKTENFDNQFCILFSSLMDPLYRKSRKL